MKTILVDAWNTLISPKGINRELYEMLETFPNQKMVLTNANTDEQEEYGINILPYPIFTCAHNPKKTEVAYFRKLLRQYDFSIADLLYIEHNELVVITAKSLGIKTFWFEKEKNDIEGVRQFLLTNLDN